MSRIGFFAIFSLSILGILYTTACCPPCSQSECQIENNYDSGNEQKQERMNDTAIDAGSKDDRTFENLPEEHKDVHVEKLNSEKSDEKHNETAAPDMLEKAPEKIKENSPEKIVEPHQRGGLIVTISKKYVVFRNFHSGQKDIIVAQYTLQALREDIIVEIISLFAAHKHGTCIPSPSVNTNIQAVKLYADGKLIAKGIFAKNGKVELKLTTPLTVEVSKEVELSIKIDLAPKNILVSGSEIYIGIASEITGCGDYWGQNSFGYKIQAKGKFSNVIIPPNEINSLGNVGGSIQSGEWYILYDGILITSKSNMAPTGQASAGPNSTVYAIDLTAAGDDITVDNMWIEKVPSPSTCKITGTKKAKWSDIQNDYVIFPDGQVWLEKMLEWSQGIVSGAKKLQIPESKTITVFFSGDTTGCQPNQVLQFQIKNSGIDWRDQEIKSSKNPVYDLPIYGGILKY